MIKNGRHCIVRASHTAAKPTATANSATSNNPGLVTERSVNPGPSNAPTRFVAIEGRATMVNRKSWRRYELAAARDGSRNRWNPKSPDAQHEEHDDGNKTANQSPLPWAAVLDNRHDQEWRRRHSTLHALNRRQPAR